MKYTVVWKPEAERRLAELWMKADNPQKLADAANLIERELGVAPDSVGDNELAQFVSLWFHQSGCTFG